MNQFTLRLFCCALFFAICMTPFTKLNAQCSSYGSYDNDQCNEQIRTYSSGPMFCQSGHCRVDFLGNLYYTLLSRTATTATYYIGRAAPGYAQIIVQMYDSVNNCTSTLDWTDRFVDWTFPDIQGSIPVCPVVGQVYSYIIMHRGNTNGFFPTETMSYAISGGTIQSTTSNAINAVYVYDTVKVTWNPAGPHRLISTRFGSGQGQWGTLNCTNRDTIDDGTGPPPTIIGPGVLCGTNTSTYTSSTFDPAFTHTWSATNGTITAGQGTANVTVNWTGSGVLTLTRTAIPCGWTSTTTKNVTISASPAPNITLPANVASCNGQAILNPGAFASYLWSNQFTTQTIGVGTAGTYSVTVTNSAGCTASASTNVTIGSGASANLGPNQTVCAGTPVTLNPGTFTSYAWSTGATTPTISPTTSGTYSVTVINSGGCTSSASVAVSFLPQPAPNLGPNQTRCTGNPTTLNPGSFSSYAWSTGATTATLTVSATGTYTVTVTGSNGCTASSAVTVTFVAAPAPNLGFNQNVCAGTTVILNPGTFASYAWSTGATTHTISPTTSGAYSVTVSNGVCTGSDVVNINFLALPSFSLGNDSFICADTTLLLQGPSGMSAYAWSTGATTSGITIGSGGTYALTVTGINNCTASDAIVIQGLTDCVFPGDANYDGVADNLDILNVGAYFGFANAPRANASTQWYGQSTPDWGGAFPGNVDPKHSDCDGNGAVAFLDTLVIHQNYGQTHTKTSGIATAGAPLRVVALQDSILPGTIARFSVTLGDAGNQADSAYGLAFTVNYSVGATAAPGLIYVDYSTCWYAPTGLQATFSQNFPGANAADLAIVRTDHTQQIGFGEVCRLGIATDPNLVPLNVPLTVWLTNVHEVDAVLGPQAVETFADSVVVSQTMTGSTVTTTAAPPRIYPNPATDLVRIDQLGATITSVCIMDATGRVLRAMEQVDAASITFPTADLAQGVYLLQIHSDQGTYLRKLAICR